MVKRCETCPGAFTLALVGFVEAISISKHFARINRYDINPGGELRALGLSNFATSLFSGYPVTAGFSRTAVNAQPEPKALWRGVFSGIVIVLTLLFLTPLFSHLPKAALAASILVAVTSLLDLKESKRLWRVKRADFAMLFDVFHDSVVWDSIRHPHRCGGLDCALSRPKHPPSLCRAGTNPWHRRIYKPVTPTSCPSACRGSVWFASTRNCTLAT